MFFFFFLNSSQKKRKKDMYFFLRIKGTGGNIYMNYTLRVYILHDKNIKTEIKFFSLLSGYRITSQSTLDILDWLPWGQCT